MSKLKNGKRKEKRKKRNLRCTMREEDEGGWFVDA